MSSTNEKDAEAYSKITDTIFAVLLGLSFRHHFYLLIPPKLTYKVVMLVFSYTVLVFSRILYQNSIKNKPYIGAKRFIVDLWILYMYFILAFSVGDIDDTPNTFNLICGVIGVFIGYLIWDLFKRQEYPNEKLERMIVTIVCLILSVITLILYLQPILLLTDEVLGAPTRDWIFLVGEFVIFTIFWKIKL